MKDHGVITTTGIVYDGIQTKGGCELNKQMHSYSYGLLLSSLAKGT